MDSIQLYAYESGRVTLKKKAVIDDGIGNVELPIPAFVIRHPRANVLFDTGLHADLADPGSTRLGNLSKYSTISFSKDEHVVAQLERLGLKPHDISLIVSSHFHYDHVGGNSAFPHAQLIVQRREWEAAHDPDLIIRNAYIPDDYDHNPHVKLVDGEYDLFGDGTLTLIPTFGHTHGHQCMLVRIKGRKIVLAADAVYTLENLERGMVSRLSFNPQEAVASLHMLAALKRNGWELLIGHDRTLWDRIPKIPEAVA